MPLFGRRGPVRNSFWRDPMISIREEVAIDAPPDAVWPMLSDPAIVASCIPGATLTRSAGTKTGNDGAYQGAMRVKFGPTIAQFRGEAKLAYDHAARRCTIEGRGIDSRGASRANASGVVEAAGDATTLLKVEGNFTVTGPLETFANAGGVHLARAILAEFADNVAKLVAERAPAGAATKIATAPCAEEKDGAGATTVPRPQMPEGSSGDAAPEAALPRRAALPRPAAAELSGGKLLWRALLSWLRQVFGGKREAG
jgi:carbon monoxide dehydrogenase subunit G